MHSNNDQGQFKTPHHSTATAFNVGSSSYSSAAKGITCLTTQADKCTATPPHGTDPIHAAQGPTIQSSTLQINTTRRNSLGISLNERLREFREKTTEHEGNHDVLVSFELFDEDDPLFYKTDSAVKNCYFIFIFHSM